MEPAVRELPIPPRTLSRALPRALERHIAQIRTSPFESSRAPRPVERLPDGTISLVFRALGQRGDLTVIGAVSRALYKQTPGDLRVISVDFKLGGAYPFFGVPMQALADRLVPLEELWGTEARGLLDRLLGCSDDAQAVDCLKQALAARLERANHLELRSAMRAFHGIRRLVRQQHDLDVPGLAAGVGLSERQLRRVFATAVGVGPKAYLRMLRFQRAIQSPELPGGELAIAAGYYDQAHLIAEFQHLARMTPRAFANRKQPGATFAHY